MADISVLRILLLLYIGFTFLQLIIFSKLCVQLQGYFV